MTQRLPFTVRPATDEEMQRLGWVGAHHQRPSVIEVDDAIFIPSKDPELNGPGELLELGDNGSLMALTPATSEE